jgi:hypothetical protein
MIAINSGDLTRPPASRPRPIAKPIASETTKPSPVAAEAVVVDVEPCDQEQERQPDQRQDLDRLVRLRPPEHRGADQDAEHDLEHDVREPEPRDEPDRERRHKSGRGDDREARERDLHERTVLVPPLALRA